MEKYNDYEVNDILHTKDGRKTGNLTIIKIFKNEEGIEMLWCISDYGNQVKHLNTKNYLENYFYKIAGKASSSHKYFDYINKNPELFV